MADDALTTAQMISIAFNGAATALGAYLGSQLTNTRLRAIVNRALSGHTKQIRDRVEALEERVYGHVARKWHTAEEVTSSESESTDG